MAFPGDDLFPEDNPDLPYGFIKQAIVASLWIDSDLKVLFIAVASLTGQAQIVRISFTPRNQRHNMIDLHR